MENSNKKQDPEPMIERHKFDTLVSELAHLRQRTRELQSELGMRQQQETGEVWYWQSEGGNHIESLVCPVVIPVQALRDLLDARPHKPANDQIRHNVIDQSYDFTIDWDGNVHGLISGDMGYDYTGIKLSAKTMKDFIAKKDSDEDLAMQARLYQRGADKRIDDVLDQFEFQASDSATWWHVVDFLHSHGNHLNAGLAHGYAMPILPRKSEFTKAN